MVGAGGAVGGEVCTGISRKRKEVNQEEFRKLWGAADSGTDEEVRETMRDSRTDPTAARMMLMALSQVVQIDRSYAPLYRVVLDALMEAAAERLANDDAFALHIAGKLLDVIEAAPPRRTPRGKVRTAKSA